MAATSIPGNTQNAQERRLLFESAMQGKWKDVVDMYSRCPWLGMEQITKGGNTALHMAVSDRQERFVEQLVEVITLPDVLKTKNKQGNTPLHLAASVGNVSMCKCIPFGRPHLVGVLNEEGETPLFLAARHGQMHAFICLLRGETEKYVKVRNKKGETILHCAINRGHFELAFRITKGYPFLISAVDEKGATPLHVLASKPGAFRSGTHLSLLGKLIYHCVPVQEIHSPLTSPNWFTALWNKIGKTTEEADNIPQGHMESDAEEGLPQRMTEILEEGSVIIKKEDPKDESRVELKQFVGSGPHIPPNYHTCFSFISLLNKAISILFFRTARKDESSIWSKHSVGSGRHDAGFSFFRMGLNYIHKVQKKKQTNIWSVKVMKQLLKLQKIQAYDYDRAGWNPNYAQTPTPYSTTDGEKENKSEQDRGTDLPSLKDLSATDAGTLENSQREQGKGDEVMSKEKLRKEGSSQKEIDEEGTSEEIQITRNKSSKEERVEEGTSEEIQKRNKSSKEAESTFTIRVGKAGLRADQIIAAKKLIDELCKEETKKKEDGTAGVETPILIAAKNGITEMVKKILDIYPIAIHDVDSEEKNVVLLAVENRHPHVYELLLNINILKDAVFGAVDNNGCSALHLAARLSENRPWLIPGAALQLQWEVMWYKYVKRSMPPNFFPSHNNNNETANQIFTRDHKDMVEKGKKWLTSTATSCSVVATLIATVAFSTSTAVPGGIREGSGEPNLELQPAFHIFAISSLIALCFSVFSTVMFLAILTSRHQERDFGQNLPTKLLLGLTSLFISILSILVTFCAGHFFVLKGELRITAIPMYAVTCLPAACFAVAQLPLYIDLIWATFSKVPQRWMEKEI